MSTPAPITLPACGTFLGTPVYLHRGDTIFQTSGPYYTSWVSEDHDAAWYIDRTVRENQGNLVAIWDGGATQQSLLAMADYLALDELGLEVPRPDWANGRFLTPQDWDEIAKHPERLGAGLVRMLRQARELGLAMMTIYTDADPSQLARMQPDLDNFLGCNVGEVFTFRLNETEDPELALARKTAGDLRQLAANFLASVRSCVQRRKAAGWSRLMVTGGIATLDYEIIGGIEIPAVEDFAVPHFNIASALSRGLYRQFNLPIWGTDLAHEHYGMLPYSCPHRMPLLTASLYMKYMAGCKLLLVESGNWWQQSDHIEDTPMHQVPKLSLGNIHVNDPHLSAPHVEAARRHYPNLNYDSPVCREYRRRISDFYDFLKTRGTPAGQPAARVAAIKGNLDLAGPGGFHPNAVIAGQVAQADKDARWFHAAPERGWEILSDTFYPRPPVLGAYKNPFLSGTPYGITDIVSFAVDPDPSFLSQHYAALLFTGWNTCTEGQYDALVAYVRAGGTLFVSIPHLSTNTRRNFTSYGADELIRGGDFSELCGVKVTGRGKQFYWAVTPGKERPLGVSPHRKFGICMTHLGCIEMQPGVEVVAVEDEQFMPLLLRHRLGRGTVYFLNMWEYPGALADDSAPSATRDNRFGLIHAVYRRIARETRGETFITDDGIEPGAACDHVAFTHFPAQGEICLYNIDFDRPHTIRLHHRETTTTITLAPAEFQMFTP